MKLLFVNALKGLRKKKVQMIGIVIMVMLSTGIYTTMNMALDRLDNRYHTYLKEQNVEDFSFVPVIDYRKDYTAEEVEQLKTKELSSISEQEMQLVTLYQMCLTMPEQGACNDSELYKNIEGLFTMYRANEAKQREIIDPIAKQYHFEYGMEVAKTVTDNKKVFKVFPYQTDKTLDIPYLAKGTYPTKDDEVALLPGFMEENDLEMGDVYSINDKKYTIVGQVYAPDYIFPLLTISSPMFDVEKHTTVFMTQNAYDEVVGYEELAYVGKFQGKEIKLQELFQKEPKLTFDMFSAMRTVRIESLKMEIDTDRTFAKDFLIVLLSVAVFIIAIITKKRIEDERLQIGVLKALGYRSTSIAVSYLVYPIIGAIVGGILGFGIGTLLHPILTKLYASYFVLPLAGYQFDFHYLLVDIVMPLVGLSFLCYFISVFMLRHKALHLLKEGSHLKVNFLSKIATKITKKLSFKERFRMSLALRSLGKLLVVSLTSFCTGLLITLVLVGMNLFSSMIDSSFAGMDFTYMVNYNTPLVDGEKDDTLIYEVTLPVKKIISSDGKEKKVKKDYEITINGTDTDSKNFNIRNAEGKKIFPQLKEDHSLVINANVREIGNIDIGDTVVFENNGTEYRYHVVDVYESFFGTYSYVNRTDLTKDLGLDLVYNKKMTDSSKYDTVKNIDATENRNIANIFGVQDLKKNMENTMAASNASIYIVIGFASFMVLIIIAVIASIVVEENKKTISLMKVMGYQNKSISSIVLNIYTPFIIVAYFLSVPVMIWILKMIVKVLTKDIDFALPIGISFTKVIIGLLALLVGYFLAIRMSRKTLDKVPLAVALKRE